MEFDLRPKFDNLSKILPSDIDTNLVNNAVNLIYMALVNEDLLDGSRDERIKTSNEINDVVQYFIIARNDVNNSIHRRIFGTSDLKMLIETLNVFFVIERSNERFTILGVRTRQGNHVFIPDGNNYAINPAYLEERRRTDTSIDAIPLENLSLMIEIFNFFRSQFVMRNSEDRRVVNLINNSRNLINRLSVSTVERLHALTQNTRKVDKIYNSLITLLQEAKKNEDIFKIELYEGLLNTYNDKTLNKPEFDKLIRNIGLASYLRKVIKDLPDELKFKLWKFIRFNNIDRNPQATQILNEIEESLETHDIRLNEDETFSLIPREIILTPSVGGGAAEFAGRSLAIARRRRAAVNFNNIVNNEEEEEEEELEFFDIEEEQVEFFDTEDENLASRILATSVLLASKGYGNFPDPTDPTNIILDNILGGVRDVLNEEPEVQFYDVVENMADLDAAIPAAFGALTTRNMALAISLLTLCFTAVFSYWYWAYNTPIETEDTPPDIGPGYGLSAQLPDLFIMSEVQRAKIVQAMIYAVDKFWEIYDNLSTKLMDFARNGWVETFIIGAVTALSLYAFPALRSYTGFALSAGTTAYLYEFIFNPDGSYADIINKAGTAVYQSAQTAGSAVYQGAELAVAGAKFSAGIFGSLGIIITVLGLGGVVYLGYKIYGKSQNYPDSRVDVKLLNK